MISTKLRLILEGAGMVLAGVICLFIALGSVFQTRHFLKTAIHVEGFVVRVNEGYEGSNYSKTVDYPVIRFRAPGGDQDDYRYEVFPLTPMKHGSLDYGSKLPLMYPPGDPLSAKTYTFRDLWLKSVIYGGVSLVLLPLGIFALLAAKKE